VSADGRAIVTEEPLRVESLELLAYMPLTQEQHTAVAQVLGTGGVDGGTGSTPDGGLGWVPRELRSPSQPWWKLVLSPFSIGEAHAQSMFGMYSPAVSALELMIERSVPGSVTGFVRAPMDRELVFKLIQPLPEKLGQEVQLAPPYDLAVEFEVSAPSAAWSKELPETVQAKLQVRGPDGAMQAAPADTKWEQEGPGLARVSTHVPLQEGQTLLKLMGATLSGTRVLEVKAELKPDADGGTSATLKLTRGVDTTRDDQALESPIRFKGLRVSVTGPGGGGAGVTGDKGGYGVPLLVPGGEEYGISCTDVPLGPKVVERTGVDGVTHYDTVMQQFGVCSPVYSVFSGRNTQADILVDARYIYGNLLFVDREGQPLDGLCGAEELPSERDSEKLGEYLSIAPRDVDTTEVHFFREDDLEHPIATYAFGRKDPSYCEVKQNPVDGGSPATHGMFGRLRLGPTHGIPRYARERCRELERKGQNTQEEKDYYEANCKENRSNFLSLSAGDRLVVFAVNHATGYAGMKTVTVPAINRSTRAEDGSCAADEAAGGPLSVDEYGENHSLSRCTQQELGIPVGDVLMYPPEIDVRVTRKMETEGEPKVKLESLVRHGGAATTRDDLIYVSTHWRVRVKPYEEGGTDGGTADGGGVDAGSDGTVCRGLLPDGGSCYPRPLVDEGDAGLVLEVYCSELSTDAGSPMRKACISGEPPLVEVPRGVPPLAGRIIGVTGTAVAGPQVVPFSLRPGGRFVESVHTALRYTKPSGEVEILNSLPRASYYLHTVGHAIYPRDRNGDGFIQQSEKNIPPPGFAEAEAPTQGANAGAVPKYALGLKNVYRHIERDGERRERFDLALEHSFRVLELKNIQITADGKTPEQDRDLKNEKPPSATEDDLSYQFLTQLLEPDVMGRPGMVSGEYVVRLGGDGFGIDCPVTINAQDKLLSASCGGEYLQDVLSANDILYIELYLSGNAENVLYRFNFEGLAARYDYLSAGHNYTVDEADKPDDDEGNASPGREIAEPPVATFFIDPTLLRTGTVRLCLSPQCGEDELLKEADLVYSNDTWQVTEKLKDGKPVGKATARLRHDQDASQNGAWRFQLPMPAEVAAMKDGTKTPPSIYLVQDATQPQAKRMVRNLGKAKGWFMGVNARARAQESVLGVNVADGHLSFSHTDFSVPHGPGTVSFTRSYNNQNDLPTHLGIGWSHNYDGWVMEEAYQRRYVAVVGGQAYPFPKCVAEPAPSTRALCAPDASHNNILIVDAPLPDLTAPEGTPPPPVFIEMRSAQGWTYRFNQVAQGRDKEGRRKWLLTRYGEERKDPGPDEKALAGTGNWTYVKYEDDSDRIQEVDWDPGTVKLAFTYKDVSDPKTPGRVLALTRTQGFKWLSRVELKHKPTPNKVLYQVDFDHDAYGNLLHAVRTQWPASQVSTQAGPYPLWSYEYHPIPAGITGPERWDAANELKGAKLIHSASVVAPPPASGTWAVPTSPVQWWATYARATESGSAGKYLHMQAYEMVASVGMTGQQGKLVTIEYPDGMKRVVTRADGVKVQFDLNAYGSITKKNLPIPGTSSEMAWFNDTSLSGDVMLKSQTSPTGRKIALQPKVSTAPGSNLLVDKVTLEAQPSTPGTQPVAGLPANGVLGTYQYANERKPGHPTGGTYPTAGGSASWSAPLDTEGSLRDMSLSLGTDTKTLLAGATYDDRGRPLAVAEDAQGRSVTYELYDEDGLGQLEKLVLTHPEANPAQAAQTHTRTFTYDAYGRLARAEDLLGAAPGGWEAWTYDGLGRVLTHTRSGTPVEEWHYEYVAEDNKLTTREWLEKHRESEDPSPRHERETLVEDGLTTREKYWVGSPHGQTPTAATLDGLRYSQVSRSYTYVNGRLDTTTDERGIVRKNIYDDNGRLRRVEINGQREMAYELDAEGRVKSKTDHLGRTTTMGFDVLGRTVSWDYGDNDVDGVELDPQGQVKRRWVGAPKAHVIEVKKLDALGHPEQQASVSATGGVSVTELRDAAGRLTSRVDGVLGLEDTYEYKDVLGRLTRHTRTVKTKTPGSGAELALTRLETRTYNDQARTITITRDIKTGPTSSRTESETQYLDLAGRVFKVERPRGDDGTAVDEYRYNERGQVRWHKSPTGAITQYWHDPVGNLVQVIAPPASDTGSGIKTTYLLHKDGRVEVEKGPHPGYSVTYAYDKFGELESKTIAGTGSTPGAMWSYAPTGTPGTVQETRTAAEKLGGALETVKTIRRFNARGKLVFEAVEQGAGYARMTDIAYDGPWERRRTVQEGSWKSTFETPERDDRGRPIRELESWSRDDLELSYLYETSTTWTGRDATIRYAWATRGASLPVGDPQRNRVMEVSVDSLGNVVRRTPKGVAATDWWLYDADGKLTRQEPVGRPATVFTYVHGLLSTETYSDEITRYTYYLDGRLQSRQDPGSEVEGRTRSYEYYPNGALKAESYGRGAVVQRTEYTYDASGQPHQVLKGAQVTGDDRKAWTYVHGARGELLSATFPDGLGTFNYTYDGLLRLRTVAATPVMPGVPGMAQQEFKYDFAGRITQRKRGGENAPYWQTTYANGEATTVPLPEQSPTSSSTEEPPPADSVSRTVRLLDGRGRPVRVIYQPTPNSEPIHDLQKVSYEYNGADQPLKIEEARKSNVTVSNVFTYDQRGLLKSVKRGIDEVAFDYTTSGQRWKVKVYEGELPLRSVEYFYDSKDRLHEIDRTPVDSARGRTTVDWEPGGQRITRIYDGALVEQRCYDGVGRVEAVINARPGGFPDCAAPFNQAISAYAYTYDARGNRLTETRGGTGFTPPEGTPSLEVTQYGYDAADRLTGVRYPDGAAVLYSLAADGTRQGEKELTGYSGGLTREAYGLAVDNPDQGTTLTRDWIYGYDAFGALDRITDRKANTLVAEITTDRFGQVRSDERDLVKSYYRWDAAGRLAEIEVERRASVGAIAQTKVSRYTYDHAGLRRMKSVLTEGSTADPEVSSWLYVGNELVEERLPDSQRLMLERAGSSVSAIGNARILHDGLDSAVGRVRAAGSPTLYTFDAWGNYRNGTGPDSSQPSIGYTGHAWDGEAGIVYAQQRWLNPSMGLFLSEDPVFGELKNPLSLHAWIYAWVNPLRYVDPTGEFSRDTPLPVVCKAQAGGFNAEFEECMRSARRIREENKALVAFEHTYWSQSLSEMLIFDMGEATGMNSLGRAGTGETEIGRKLSFKERVFELFSGALTAVDTATTVTTLGMAAAPKKVLKEGAEELLEQGLKSQADEVLTLASSEVVENRLKSQTDEVVGAGLKTESSAGRSALAEVSETAESQALKDCSTGNCGIPGRSCFVAGTLVSTSEGLKPIEEVREGDQVLSRDPSTGQIDWRPVVRTIVTPGALVLEVTLVAEDGTRERLGVTADHPFWVEDKGWVEAKDLELGSRILSATDAWLTTESVAETMERTIVYNFEVADYHTYFVGTQQAWVHNSDCPLSPEVVRAYEGREAALGGVDPLYVADPRTVIDMPYVGAGAKSTNKEGWLRDQKYFWQEFSKRHPDAFDASNRLKIKMGFAPVANKQFRKYFPQYDRPSVGRSETLHHHHIGGGGQAFPVPKNHHNGNIDKGIQSIHVVEEQAGVWGADSGIAARLQAFVDAILK
jgi:RHS repeat-associated protein